MSNLVKTNFFPSLRTMMDDFWNTDRFFSQPIFKNDFLPAVNIRDKENQYELEVSAPGFKKKDFSITTDNGLLTISAESDNEAKEDSSDYTRREFSHSSFSRTFSLPENIAEDEIKAGFNDGLLKIILKKSNNKVSTRKQVLIG